MTDPRDDGDADDLGAAEPTQVMALLEQQRSGAVRELSVDSSLLYLFWGTAWALGYTALFLASFPGDEAVLPLSFAGWVFAALLIAAGAATALHIRRRVRGIRGPSSEQGTMYGLAWFLGFAGMAAIGEGLSRAGMSDSAQDLYYFAAPGLIVALLYLGGGTLWQDRVMYGLGAWFIVVFGAATVLGAPENHLLAALLGGGAFLVAGLWERRRSPRPV